MNNTEEPPLRGKKGSKLGRTFSPAIRGFLALADFPELIFGEVDLLRDLVFKLIQIVKKYFVRFKGFLKRKGLTRSLVYKFFVVAIIAVLPLVSRVSAEAQAYEDAIHFSQTIDPIESARFAVYFSQYTPGLYIDADEVALAAVTSNDSYTLEQQLAVNAGKNFDVPGREDPTYILKPGETVVQVASKFNLHVGSLVDANNLDPVSLKYIKPGTVLVIPSSDTNTSDDWLVAINEAEAREIAEAAAMAEKKRQESIRVRLASTSNTSYTTSSRSYSGGSVTIIGTSFSQCVPWAREQSGIPIQGYAGNVAATQSQPRVGGVALDRFYGHASVVVGIGDGYITVHEANWIRGKITERRVSMDAIRGYVY